MNIFQWLIGYSVLSSSARQRVRNEMQQEQLRQELAEKWAKSPEQHRSFKNKSKATLTWGNFWTYLVLIVGGFLLYMAWKTWTM